MQSLAVELAHHMGLVPLAWLGALQVRGFRRDRCWWWIAWAFAISWFADSAAHWIDPDFVGTIYPIAQAAIIGAVLLDTDEALSFVMLLCVVGIATLATSGGEGVELFLATVCSLGVAGVAWQYQAMGSLRVALLIAFGIGWVSWLAFALWPGWTSWGGYQAVRLVSLLCFCWACVRNRPRMILVHS